MFDRNFPGYARTPEGLAEFGSVVLTIDSALTRPNDPQVIQKIVLSTEGALQSVASLVAYFGQPQLLSSPAALGMFQESGKADNPVYVFVTPRNGVVEVVMSTDTWGFLESAPQFGNGSLLLMSEKLTQVVAQSLSSLMGPGGGYPPLFMFDVSAERPEGADEPETLEDKDLNEDRV